MVGLYDVWGSDQGLSSTQGFCLVLRTIVRIESEVKSVGFSDFDSIYSNQSDCIQQLHIIYISFQLFKD